MGTNRLARRVQGTGEPGSGEVRAVGTAAATSGAGNSYASNDFTSATTSTVLVDDFNAPAGDLLITDVSAAVMGFGGTFVSLADVPAWQVSIYVTAPTNSATSLAGTYGAIVLAGGVTLTAPYDTSASSGLVSIPVDILLPAAGKYYLSVEAVNSIITNGEIAVYSTAPAFSPERPSRPAVRTTTSSPLAQAGDFSTR